MTFDAVKKEMHDFIDHADRSKVLAIYDLINNTASPVAYTYDEATLNSLEQTRDDMRAGKQRSYTLEETLINIRNHRNRDGI